MPSPRQHTYAVNTYLICRQTQCQPRIAFRQLTATSFTIVFAAIVCLRFHAAKDVPAAVILIV